MALHLLNHRLAGRLHLQRLVRVLVVDIVADAHELAVLVAAAEEDDGDADDLAVGNASKIRRVGLEDELVDADGDRADEHRVQLLVVLGGGGRADIREFPFEVCWCLLAGCLGVKGSRSALVKTGTYPSAAIPSTRT